MDILAIILRSLFIKKICNFQLNMPFTNPQSTATPKQIKAAEETIKLATIIEKFVVQSQAVEKSNKRLTYLIIILSIIQTISAVIVLFK